MEIINSVLLSQSELNLIKVLELYPIKLSDSLVFNISDIVKPIGTTKIVVENKKDPERTETIDLQVSQTKIDGLKCKLEKYHNKAKEAEKKFYEELRKLNEIYDVGGIPPEEKMYLGILEMEWGNWVSLERSLEDFLDLLNSYNGKTFTQFGETLGEYVPADDCIKLYIDTISRRRNRKEALIYTLVHELFHAFYHKQCNKTHFTVIKEIDEAMVEFSMLTYISQTRQIEEFQDCYDSLMNGALNTIKQKQQGIGLLPSYGFGAFLFENCSFPEIWMAQYCLKYGLIDNTSNDVLSYKEDLYPIYTCNELRTRMTLANILFDDDICRKMDKEIHSGTLSNKTNSPVYSIKYKIDRDKEWRLGVYPNIVIDNPRCIILHKKVIEYYAHFKDCVTEIEFLDGVERIEIESFYNCKKLVSVKMNSTIKSIGKNAFSGCRRLQNVFFSPDLRIIGENAFRDCQELNDIDIPNTVIIIQRGAFSNCGLRKLKLPDILELKQGAFTQCKLLTHVELPDSIYSIEPDTFAKCYSLESVKMPCRLLHIGHSAFKNCQSLRKIDLPDSLLDIEPRAFEQCGLTTIDIPKLVERIKDKSFEGCCNLSSIAISSHTKVANDAIPNEAVVITT